MCVASWWSLLHWAAFCSTFHCDNRKLSTTVYCGLSCILNWLIRSLLETTRMSDYHRAALSPHCNILMSSNARHIVIAQNSTNHIRTQRRHGLTSTTTVQAWTALWARTRANMYTIVISPIMPRVMYHESWSRYTIVCSSTHLLVPRLLLRQARTTSYILPQTTNYKLDATST